jgi:flagellar motor switch/type III secretory pathway protein FliN
MSETPSVSTADIVAACQAGLEPIAATIGRVLETTLTAELGSAKPFDAGDADFAESAIVVLFGLGAHAALAVIPATGGLLPPWVADGTPTSSGKLQALAEELVALVLPASAPINDMRADYVEHLAAALTLAEPTSHATVVPVVLKTAEGRQATLSLIMPFKQGSQVFATAAAMSNAEDDDGAPEPIAAETAQHLDVDSLPPYSRSLLKIKVPVAVTLARKQQPIAKIIEIGPGTIIQFRKSCEQTLELEVNGHEIGEGEAVKVGDKFGLRVTGMKLPGERFHTVRRAS